MRSLAAWASVILLVAIAFPARANPATQSPAGPGRNVVVLFHPGAELDLLLHRPGLVRYLGGLSKTPTGEKSSLDKLGELLANARRFWPRELGLELSATGVSEVDALVRLLMLSLLCEGADNAGKKGQRDLPKLQQALLIELGRLRVPSATVWMDFADPARAAAAMALLSTWLENALSEAKVRPTVYKDGMMVRTTLAALFPQAELKAMLIEMDWLSGANDRQSRRLVAALAAVPIEAQIEARGSRLQLSLGTHDSERNAFAAERPPSISPTQLLGFVQWDALAFKDCVRGWAKLWDTWKNTAAGREARRADDDDFWGTPAQMVRQLDRASDQGKAWLWGDQGLHFLVDEVGGRSTPALTDDPILGALPANAVAVDVDARANLGERISASLSRIEDRLGARAFVELLETGKSSTAAQNEATYYQRAASLRELIHEVAPLHFEGASAFVVGPGARVKWAKVQDAGNPARIGQDLPVPEVAWIGRAKHPDAALQFASQAWETVASAVAKGGALDETPALVLAPPPASNARSYWFDLDWFERWTTTTVTGDGGFRPNLTVSGSFVILATSPELAMSIVTTLSLPAKNRLSPPAVGKPLVAWSSYPCARLAAQLRDGVQTLAQLFGTDKFAEQVEALLPPLCGLVDGFESTTVQEGDHLVSCAHLRAAPTLYR